MYIVYVIGNLYTKVYIQVPSIQVLSIQVLHILVYIHVHRVLSRLSSTIIALKVSHLNSFSSMFTLSL